MKQTIIAATISIISIGKYCIVIIYYYISRHWWNRTTSQSRAHAVKMQSETVMSVWQKWS